MAGGAGAGVVIGTGAPLEGTHSLCPGPWSGLQREQFGPWPGGQVVRRSDGQAGQAVRVVRLARWSGWSGGQVIRW